MKQVDYSVTILVKQFGTRQWHYLAMCIFSYQSYFVQSTSAWVIKTNRGEQR